jgi:hypothetical protein
MRPVSSVKVLGYQRPRRRRTVAATGIAACHPLVPSGQGAALTLVRKIDATSLRSPGFEDEDDDDDEDENEAPHGAQTANDI